ncbi:MAG: hypothetical protein ACUVSV_16005 [Armatimonadota bacterium]
MIGLSNSPVYTLLMSMADGLTVEDATPQIEKLRKTSGTIPEWTRILLPRLSTDARMAALGLWFDPESLGYPYHAMLEAYANGRVDFHTMCDWLRAIRDAALARHPLFEEELPRRMPNMEIQKAYFETDYGQRIRKLLFATVPYAFESMINTKETHEPIARRIRVILIEMRKTLGEHLKGPKFPQDLRMILSYFGFEVGERLDAPDEVLEKFARVVPRLFYLQSLPTRAASTVLVDAMHELLTLAYLQHLAAHYVPPKPEDDKEPSKIEIKLPTTVA